MFGYIRPNKGELKVKEFDQYKGVYCTLCKEIGTHYGRVMRMALSYDLTYYTMLALDLSQAKPCMKKGKCVVNPTKKCNYICLGEEAYKKGAALTVLMTYHKIRDNIKDESFFKALGARCLLPWVSGSAKKAKKDFPFMANAVENMMIEQEAVEKTENPSLDACCDPTAKALSEIFKELGAGDKDKELVLSQLGYFLGRWVYTMDASDDLAKDMKDSSFNPFIDKLGLAGLKIIPEDRQREIDEECNQSLNGNVAMINSAMNLLDLNIFGNIITNITEQGLAEVQREILFLHIKKREGKVK